MKYFIPEWDDRVDPAYDFIKDTHSSEHRENPLKNDVYIWDIFGIDKVPIDGVLVSKMAIIQNKKKYNQILREGIHRVLHLPENFEIIGDCGAWGYVEEDEPPFKTSEVLDYYFYCGFNYGTSVDHLITSRFEDQKKKRWKITLENAREMFELWESKDKYIRSLRIIGVAQGWDVNSYRKAVCELLSIGYDYIGLGGLARSPTGNTEFSNSKTIYNVVRGVNLEVRKWMEKTKKKIDIHIFGVTRPEIMPELAGYGITSFDSASFLRKAWLRTNKNYYTLNGKFYGAIRIPQARKSPLTRKLKNLEILQNIEKNALNSIRKYDQGKLSLEETLNAILEYDSMINKERKRKVDLKEIYKRTLEDKPWKKCPCTICKNIGVEVIIFRNNDRNRRRGFHNIWTFYKNFRKKCPRILVFTNCTLKKNKNKGLMPAFERYLPSPNFKIFWNYVFDLPVEIGILSAKFGLIDWSKRIPYYERKLKKNEIPILVKDLEEKLKQYDKVFFIGLGLYREVVQRVRDKTGYEIDIFPKEELSTRKKLDIIEYARQIKIFREKIIKNLPEKCRPSKFKITLEKYVNL